MAVSYFICIFGLFLICLDYNEVSGFNVDRDLDRLERQYGLFKSLVGYLPKGEHKLDLGPWGGIELGIHEDGSVGIGGEFNPITGVALGGSAVVGGSDAEGLGIRAKGNAAINNEWTGIHAGVGGGYEGTINGLSGHGHGSVEGGASVAGIGVHGGVDAGLGASLGLGGLSADVEGGANVGGNVGALSAGGGVNAGVGGNVGLTGVSGEVQGGANAGAGIAGLGGFQGGVNAGVGGSAGLAGVSAQVGGGASGGADLRVQTPGGKK